MNGFEPRDPDWEPRVRASFGRQAFMRLLGIEIAHAAPGEIDLSMAYAPELTQQHGFFHAGTTTSIADSAAGYAALSLYPKGTGVLTTEFKINLLNPAKGDRLVARGRVVKPGRGADGLSIGRLRHRAGAGDARGHSAALDDLPGGAGRLRSIGGTRRMAV